MTHLESATHILAALIISTPELDDMDRAADMASYMAMKLETNMLKSMKELEAKVWPETVTSEPGDAE